MLECVGCDSFLIDITLPDKPLLIVFHDMDSFGFPFESIEEAKWFATVIDLGLRAAEREGLRWPQDRPADGAVLRLHSERLMTETTTTKPPTTDTIGNRWRSILRRIGPLAHEIEALQVEEETPDAYVKLNALGMIEVVARSHTPLPGVSSLVVVFDAKESDDPLERAMDMAEEVTAIATAFTLSNLEDEYFEEMFDEIAEWTCELTM
jgi:hypothetical protein